MNILPLHLSLAGDQHLVGIAAKTDQLNHIPVVVLEYQLLGTTIDSGSPRQHLLPVDIARRLTQLLQGIGYRRIKSITGFMADL